MAEYIEREALPQKRERGFFLDDYFNAGWNACLDEIAKLPTADVRPAVRGKWIKSDLDKDCVTCSNCKKLKFDNRHAFTPIAFEEWGLNFCPNCGADMRSTDG